jgi:hypothetical protein
VLLAINNLKEFFPEDTFSINKMDIYHYDISIFSEL